MLGINIHIRYILYYLTKYRGQLWVSNLNLKFDWLRAAYGLLFLATHHFHYQWHMLYPFWKKQPCSLKNTRLIEPHFTQKLHHDLSLIFKIVCWFFLEHIGGDCTQGQLLNIHVSSSTRGFLSYFESGSLIKSLTRLFQACSLFILIKYINLCFMVVYLLQSI